MSQSRKYDKIIKTILSLIVTIKVIPTRESHVLSQPVMGLKEGKDDVFPLQGARLTLQEREKEARISLQPAAWGVCASSK